MTDTTDHPPEGPDDKPSNVVPLIIPPNPEAEIRKLSALTPVQYGQQRKGVSKLLGIPVGILDAEVKKTRRAPRVNGVDVPWILAENGFVMPVYANAIAAIRAHPKDFDLSFSMFSTRPYLNGAPLEDGSLLQIAEDVQHLGVLAGKKIIDEAVFRVASERPFHEVKDWLETLKWDGVERLDTILVDHANAADTPITRAMTSKWMIQAVARIYDPGCQADAMLILAGDQGVGKSTFFRGLFGPKWFTDHLPDLNNKDASIQLLGIWCVEVAEMAATGRHENAVQKRFLTSTTDRYRMPWDRLATDHPRQCVFAGTVNDAAFLKDETGGRRFWPVTVGAIDTMSVSECRYHYWAEAVARYKDGEIWHMPMGELTEAAQEAQADRYITDPWQEIIERHIAGKSEIRIQDIFTDCLNITAKADWTQADQNRIARCLAHLRWVRKQKRDVNQSRYWCYIPPVTTSPEGLEINNYSGDTEEPQFI